MVHEATQELNAAALTSFGEAFEGEIVLPGSADYDAARIVWNAMIDRRPAVVARCSGPRDVIRAIRFAREQDLVIAVRSGGHSVGGFSTCDGGIVIDLSRMRGVRVDPDRRIARVNGGSLLSELDQEAQVHGLACPVGVVGHTGVAGLTLGGGMGRLQRHWGFSIDNMLAVDLVTAAGEQLRVSDEENADLFWGILGAGPNFGVVTGFEFPAARARHDRDARDAGVPGRQGARGRRACPRVLPVGAGRGDDLVRAGRRAHGPVVPPGDRGSSVPVHGDHAFRRRRRGGRGAPAAA